MPSDWDTNGTDPQWKYVGWTHHRPFSKIADGLSKTFLAGEKHVLQGHEGERNYGDNSLYNDEGYYGATSACRVVGPKYPLANSPNDRRL